MSEGAEQAGAMAAANDMLELVELAGLNDARGFADRLEAIGDRQDGRLPIVCWMMAHFASDTVKQIAEDTGQTPEQYLDKARLHVMESLE